MTAQRPAAPETEEHRKAHRGLPCLDPDDCPLSAPETETDANGLRELLAAATPGPWQHFGDHLVWPSERGPAANDPIAGVNEAHEECAALIVAAVNALPALLADLGAARERVRVVEGEREAARAGQRESWKYVCEIAGLIGVEPDDGHPMDAVDRLTARAESAEAAHEAERAAHERLRAGVAEIASAITLTAKQVREQGDVRQVVLGDDGVDEGPTLADELWAFGFNLTTILGGGEAR